MIEEATRALTFALYFVGIVAFVVLAGLAITGLARVGTRIKDRIERTRIRDYRHTPRW